MCSTTQGESGREGRAQAPRVNGSGPSRVRRTKDGWRAAHLPFYLWAYPRPSTSKQHLAAYLRRPYLYVPLHLYVKRAKEEFQRRGEDSNLRRRYWRRSALRGRCIQPLSATSPEEKIAYILDRCNCQMAHVCPGPDSTHRESEKKLSENARTGL